MTFTEGMDHVAKAFEALGAAVLVLGLLLSLALAGASLVADPARPRRLPDPAGDLRGRAVARPGDPGGRRPRPHRRGRADPRERGHPRADRADPDVPQLLAGDRDRGYPAVASGTRGRRPSSLRSCHPGPPTPRPGIDSGNPRCSGSARSPPMAGIDRMDPPPAPPLAGSASATPGVLRERLDIDIDGCDVDQR